MKGLRHFFCAVFLASGIGVTLHAQLVAVHDPWLNWDLINYGPPASDFQVVVDTSGWTPSQTFNDAFDNVTTSQQDVDGDGDLDTVVHWTSTTGVTVPTNGVMHAGMYMLGSGSIVSANWTDAVGNPLPPPIPLTYELTLVTTPLSGGASDIAMKLSSPTDLVDTYPAGQIGWAGIRTFMDLPASLLGLPDLNESLDLSLLAPYETAPREGGPSGLVLDPLTTYYYGVESFFDVFVGTTPNTGPQYESLLYAEVWFDPDPSAQGGEFQVGQFWNLNPQSPEPSTAVCLLFASVCMLFRRCRRA